jgi:methanogenic corrinoid protein MtbC1
MKQQPITEDSLNEADAMRLVRQMSGGRRMQQAESTEADGRRAVLTRTVENEVIPRLLMACRTLQPTATAPMLPIQADPLGAEQVDRLVALVLAGGEAEATDYVASIHEAGTPTESLFLDLLAPTARHLGRMWEDDTCTFSDVTMGLIRLGNVMRLLSRAFADAYNPDRKGPSALLVQMPGEQHGFGLAMVVQFFRRAGWNVRQEPVVSSADLVALVRQGWFGIVGISVACSDRIDALAAEISAIRMHSRNRAIGVMVGGPPFLAHPQLAAMVGADATAIDGRQAVRQAHSLLALSARDR